MLVLFALLGGCSSECADCVTHAELDAAVEAAVEAALAAQGEDVVRLIAEDTTLHVPADFATVTDALSWLDGRQIAHDATVTIQIADGSYTSETLRVSHANGARLAIVGNALDPSLVQLHFTGGSGVEVANGGALGALNGLTLVGDGVTPDAHGVFVHDNATLSCGPSVVVEGFGGKGFYANQGGVLLAEGTVSTGNADGYVAMYGSYIDAVGASASDNGNRGLAAIYNSQINAGESSAEGNGGEGYFSFASAIDASGATATANGGSGLSASYGGVIAGDATDVRDNAVAGRADGGALLALTNAVMVDNLEGVLVSNGSYADVQRATISGTDLAVHARNASATNTGDATLTTTEPSSVSTELEGSYLY